MDWDFDMFQNMIDVTNAKSDKEVSARFYDRAVKTTELDDNGLPKFKNVCFVEIRMRDCYDVYNQPATPDKIKRFPLEYNRYLLSKKQVQNSSPLEQFAFLSAAQIEALKFRGIFTVEALAQLSDEKALELGVVRERDLAVKFLKNAQSNAKLDAWQKQEEAYLNQIDKLKVEIERLKKVNMASSRRHKK